MTFWHSFSFLHKSQITLKLIKNYERHNLPKSIFEINRKNTNIKLDRKLKIEMKNGIKTQMYIHFEKL